MASGEYSVELSAGACGEIHIRIFTAYSRLRLAWSVRPEL